VPDGLDHGIRPVESIFFVLPSPLPSILCDNTPRVDGVIAFICLAIHASQLLFFDPACVVNDREGGRGEVEGGARGGRKVVSVNGAPNETEPLRTPLDACERWVLM